MKDIIILTKGKMKEVIEKFIIENIEFSSLKNYLYEEEFEYKNEYLIIATGDMKLRRQVWEKYKNCNFLNINRSKYSPQKMGKGNIIFPEVFFDYFTEIGNNNIISAGTTVNHHCKIGDSNLFGPGCHLSGSVIVGNNCTFGSGVIVEPNSIIKDNTTIPSGTIIIGNIEGRIIAKRNKNILSGEYKYSSLNK